MQTTPHPHNTPIPCTSGEASHREETTTSPTGSPAGPALCLALLGADRFMLPAMACIVLFLTICKTPLENAESRAWAKARQNQETAPAAYDDPAQANRQGGLPK